MGLGKTIGCSLLLALMCVTTAFAVPRFSDNGDQTVTDNLTGLTWTKNASLLTLPPDFQEAEDYVAAMNNAGSLGHNDWRMPSYDELWSLVDLTQSLPALPAGHPFTNVQPSTYWSTTPDNGSLTMVLEVDFAYGYPDGNHMWNNDFMWPVRGVMSGSSGYLAIAPASKDFGTLPVNTASGPQAFTLSNTGTANLVVGGISITGGDSALFRVTAGTCGSLTPTIAAGNSCAVSVTFTTPTAGAKAATLRIASNDQFAPTKDAFLSGAGADTIAPVVTQFGIPATTPSLTVPITAFTATDNVAVTGYCVTETNSAGSCTWSAIIPTQHTFADAAPALKTLYAWARDGAGNMAAAKSASVTITIGDTTAPALIISTLADGRVTNNAILNISGTATDANGISGVAIAGSPVAVNPDGSFSYPVMLQPGTTTITTVASDSAGNRTVDTRRITLDQLLPALTIIAPADNSTANRSFITVTGTIVPPVAGVAVAVNGGTAQSATISGSAFSATVNLSSGLNTIEVTVTDLSGKKNTLKRTVVSNAQDPTINIIAPVQDFATTLAAQTVYGTIADAVTPVAVTVSDGNATYQPLVANGSFNQALTLTETNIYAIVVTVTENNGNQTTVRRNIRFTKPNSGSRFSDLGDQTVTDNLTGLMWTRNANLPTTAISWQQALDYVAAMNSANGGAGTLGHNDWRLPNIDELESLVDHSRSAPTLPAGHPFLGVQSDYYWSATVPTGSYSYIFGVDMSDGITYGEHNWNFGFAWPVRGAWAASSLPSSITGAAYSQQLTTGGGTPPFTWSLVAGALPAGLTLNTVTGTITGIPTKSGVFSFTVQIGAAGVTTETRRLDITITDVACVNAPVRIGGATPVPYADFPGAYAQAADNDIIQLQALDFTGDLLLNRNIRVSLTGGYDCGYTGNAAAAGMLGAMRVSNGTVKVENLRFK